MNPIILSLSDCVEMSISKNPRQKGEIDARFDYDDIPVYAAQIGDREFTLMTEKKDYIFVVDTYGDRSTCELFDWEDKE